MAICLPWAANGQTLNEGFESTTFPPTEWSTIHVSGSSNWARSTSYHNSGSACAYMTYDYSGHENYLVTPKLTPASGESFAFYIKQTNSSWTGTTITVEVSTTTATAAAFTSTLATYTSGSGGNLSTSFESKSINLSGYVGQNIYIAFHVVDDNGNNICIDDVSGVSLYVPSCPKPTNLTCTASTGNPTPSATFTWTNGGTETNWLLEYGTTSDFTGASSKNISQSDLQNGAYTLNTGLTAETKYYARIKANCGGGDDSDWSNTIDFKPSNSFCNEIGTGTSTAYLVYTSYGCTYSQHIYTAAELTDMGFAAGDIVSVSFYYSGASSTYDKTQSIYMGTTTKSSYSGYTASDFESDVTLVYGPTLLSYVAGWREYELTEPFTWDGASNIVVGMLTNANNGTSSGWSAYGTSTGSDYRTVYRYRDSTPIDITNLSAVSNGSRSTTRPNINLCIVASATPKPRNLEVSNITSEGATVTWEAPADNVTGYQYQYKYATTPTWPETWNSLGANVTHKDLVALEANTLYDFRVRANYADGDSDPAEIQFTTEATCLPVTDIIVSDITSDGAKLAWTPGGTEINWQYLTVAHGDTPDWTSDRVLTSNVHANVPANIAYCTGQPVQPNTEYDFYVRANCGGGDYSEAAMLTFRTACGAITSFPWSENFNGYSTTATGTTTPSGYPNVELPGCWTFLNRSETSSTYPQVYLSSYSDYAVSGNCLFFKSSKDTPLYAVLPEFGTNISGLELSFTYRNEGTGANNGTLYVSYMTDPNDASTFNDANAVACAQTQSKTPMDVVLPNAPAGSYFAFKYQGGSSNNYYLAIDDVTVKVPVFITANQIVNTVSDPATEMTWSDFVSHWNNGDHFTNTTFTLMNDINVNTMVGTADKPFTGTFDGNSHTITVSLTATDNSFTAPFRVIKNATIQNLKVDGTINDGGHKFCAGFAGDCYGNNTFTNCVSDVTINASIEGDGTHGGFIARNYGSSATGNNLATTTFNGCAFTGKLLGANTNQSAGFCGWTEYQSPNYARTVFNNCLFAPSQVTMSTTSAAAFARRRSASYLTINSCYFMEDFNDGTNNTAQGKQAYTITGAGNVTVDMAGTPTTYNVSGISAYTVGIVYNSNIYAGDGDNVSLTLSGAPGYEANHGTLEASGANYTLTMEAYNTEISGVDCPVPFNVAANDLTATSAKIAWEGNSDTYKLMYRNVITAPVDVNDTYDFEDNTLQDWIAKDNDGDGNAWMVSSSPNTGSYCARSYYTPSGSGYNANNWLISPQTTLGGAISFYAKQYNNNGDERFQVFVSTTGTNISDFTAISEVINPSNSYQQYTYSLSGYSGQGYIAIVHTSTTAYAWYVYVDDIHITASIEGEYGAWQTVNPAVSAQPISSLTPKTTYQVKVSGFCGGVETDESQVVEFTTPATCPAPTALAVTEGSVTAHEATITWTENGEATTWIVEYADNADFTNFSTETVEDDATYSFDELDGETTYYVRVKAHCDVEDESDYSNVVNFTTLVACPAPTVLTVTEITTTSAKLSWTENGTATAWQICLNGDETNLIPANSNPFVLDEGLTAATSYTVKVRANCGGIDGESGWSNTVSFATACGAITTFPWSQDFESFDNNTVPTCWDNSASTTLDEGTSNYYVWGVVTVSGNNMIKMENYWAQEGTALINTPTIVLPAQGVHQLSFDYAHNATCGAFAVNVSTDNGTTFTELASYTKGSGTSHTEPGNFTPATISLANYAGESIILQFFANANYGDGAIFVDNVEIAPVFTKTIEAVGDENWEDGKGGYYLIASPLAEDVTPNADNGFITDNYDLYYFSQTGDSEGNEWINFKDETLGGFDIVNGTGYLYASKEGTVLTFTGAPYSGNGTVTLSKTTGAEFAGHNLVGNPFGEDAYITKSFYTLENSDTYSPNTAEVAIHAMQGLLVVANEDGETLTFSTEAPAKAAKLNMNVTKGRALVDQAIISFNEGQQLPKLQFRNGSTKVYIPQEGKDYAIVSAESSMGEMPVNFKAENNGTYTLSFTSEEVSFAYLHLIDNMTGIETDLLANPSYSFDARTTDYESRFKLVFATGNNANDDNFAFFSNGSFVINNEGEATLQVIDVNGRILKSESINGCANVNVKAAAGVYMLRLVNGNDVKVQKVVVR